MKIAVTSPFGWPYVRRGNRVIYELASYLASQGNEVHFITTKPGDVRREKTKGNLLIKYYPVIDHPVLTKIKIEYWQTFALSCLSALLKEDYDIVHTSLTMDAFAASLNYTLKGTPFVPVLINGDPLYTDARRAKRLFLRVVKKASRLVTISNFVNGVLKRDFDVEGVMIPCPVDTSKFYYIEKEKSDFPRILCTATPIMERKRVPLLVKAFEILIKHIPGAILQLAGETTPEVTKNLLMAVDEKTRASIEIINITSDDVLASFYRNATITVLPSIKEPFGMVTTESLASGTPVVGTRSGGTAEILDNKDIGVMFEPTDGPEELCQALIKCIELGRNPETPKRCVEHAQRYSWNTLGPKYMKLNTEILNTVSRNFRLLNRLLEKKKSLPVTYETPLSSNGSVNNLSLNRLFTDTLDELEITAQQYYQIESCKPRSVYILKWILAKEIRGGKIMMLCTYPHFLVMLLKKFAFTVTHIVLNNRTYTDTETSDCIILNDPHALKKLEGHFEIIVCDDILHYLASPECIFQILKQRLSPEGVLIFTIPNISRGMKRFNVISGGSDNLSFRDNLRPKASLRTDMPQLLCHRKYTPTEIEEAAVKAGFSVLQKSCIRGKKHIDKTNAFARVPLNKYLVQKLRYSFDRVVAPLRSHLFMALKPDRRGR
jgi:glycosyltransferase involved in cell wall biosynthesis/SAM-dependent methyltransferase